MRDAVQMASTAASEHAAELNRSRLRKRRNTPCEIVMADIAYARFIPPK
jgi:hypothetical protein